jgi:hypothetical protein
MGLDARQTHEDVRNFEQTTFPSRSQFKERNRACCGETDGDQGGDPSRRDSRFSPTIALAGTRNETWM